MKYQETGRFGRITRNLRKLGFQEKMDEILIGSDKFNNLKKVEQTDYVRTTVNRMRESIGEPSTEKVLFECGAQCCGKSWSNFAKQIWNNSNSVDAFFLNLNEKEKKYNTTIAYHANDNTIIVERSKCICGLINKGKPLSTDNDYCKCSIGHMSVFFNSVFSVVDITFVDSIFLGASKCSWSIKIKSIV